MRQLLILPALLWCYSSFAQISDCTAIKKENEVLKAKLAVLSPGSGAGSGGTSNGVTVTDGDGQLPIRFVSCTARKATGIVTLVFVVNNPELPGLRLRMDTDQFSVGNPTHGYDEQGTAYKSREGRVGASDSGQFPTGIPVKCSVSFQDISPTVTRLRAVEVSFTKYPKPSTNDFTKFTTRLSNVPITWKP